MGAWRRSSLLRASASLTLVAISACAPRGAIGALTICSSATSGGSQDVFIETSGTVVPNPDGTCAEAGMTTISVRADNGAVTTVGLRVHDDDGTDLTPALAVPEGTPVELLYRHTMPWGSAAGFVLRDADGLVVAAHQGAWGGGLESTDLPELAVTRGAVAGVVPEQCQNRRSYELVFDADTSVALAPVSSGTLTVGSQSMTAIAVASYDWVESAVCMITDISHDPGSWIVHR